MKLTTYPTASAFLDAVGHSLGEREAEHHLVLGVAHAVASKGAAAVNLFAASVDDENGIALAALMIGDRPLLIASDREDVGASAALLWSELSSQQIEPKHVIGAVGQADVAVREWQRRHDREARLAMRQRVYRLDAVAPLSPTPGTLRVATLDDLDLLTEWTHAFEVEALAVVPQSSRSSVELRIATGEIRLWCDPEPRTMAASARPTSRAVAVNGVYTPPEWRRRGYATACVAALSAVLLERFQFCVLYTDLSNPTSNSIYTRIGYRPVRDSLMYELPSARAG